MAENDVLAIVVFVGFVVFAVVVIVLTQVVGPRRRLLRFTKEMTARGWQEHEPRQAPGWPAIEKVALEGVKGRERRVEYDERHGPVKERVTVE